jgi:hypothetical protein
MSDNEIKNLSGIFSVKLDVYLFMEDGAYIAYAPALDLCGYGTSEDEAKMSFDTVVKEYLAYGVERRTLVKDLRLHGWKVRSLKQRKLSSPTFDVLLNSNDMLRDILQNKDYRKVSENMPLPALA